MPINRWGETIPIITINKIVYYGYFIEKAFNNKYVIRTMVTDMK